jgi:hypothetical protein
MVWPTSGRARYPGEQKSIRDHGKAAKFDVGPDGYSRQRLPPPTPSHGTFPRSHCRPPSYRSTALPFPLRPFRVPVRGGERRRMGSTYSVLHKSWRDRTPNHDKNEGSAPQARFFPGKMAQLREFPDRSPLCIHLSLRLRSGVALSW